MFQTIPHSFVSHCVPIFHCTYVNAITRYFLGVPGHRQVGLLLWDRVFFEKCFKNGIQAF